MGRNGVGKTPAQSINGLALPSKKRRDHPMKGAALNKQAQKTRLIQAFGLCALKGAIFFLMLTVEETCGIGLPVRGKQAYDRQSERVPRKNLELFPFKRHAGIVVVAICPVDSNTVAIWSPLVLEPQRVVWTNHERYSAQHR